jgi:hypothetical protein
VSDIEPTSTESSEPPTDLPALIGASALTSDKPAGRSWLIWLAGAQPERMHDRRDRVLFGGAGLTFLIYGVYAIGGVAAVCSMVGAPWWAGALVGAMIAVVVITYDRGIIATSRARLDDLADPRGELNPLASWRGSLLAKMIVRLLIALVLAVAISEPLMLVLFNKDVTNQLATNGDKLKAAAAKKWKVQYDKPIGVLQRKDTTTEKKITAAQARPQQLVNDAIAERKGTGATGLKSCGRQCHDYLAEAHQATNQLKATLAPYQRLLALDATQEKTLQQDKKHAQQALQHRINADTGFVARESALFQLLHNSDILFRYIVFVLVLLFVEMAGVLAKLFAGSGTYERDEARISRAEERVKRGLSLEGASGDRTRFTHRAELDERAAANDFQKRSNHFDLEAQETAQSGTYEREKSRFEHLRRMQEFADLYPEITTPKVDDSSTDTADEVRLPS